jgi:hypothetical protein
MTTCSHCQQLRAKLEEIRDRHGLDAIPRWGENVAVDVDLTNELHPMIHSTAGAKRCACECHAPARIAGKLPRLERAA